MKTVIIHGQSHMGSTCHIARILAGKLGGEVTEFFLPRDFGHFCVGCTQCFVKSETLCPHYDQLRPITEVMDRADVILLASPVYVFHVTGAMKAFLDHYGYRWMVHRPEQRMFQKQAVCISTAAGGGMSSANKDLADSAFFWGIPKIYRYGVGVRAVSWDSVQQKQKARIERELTRLAATIRRRHGQVSPGLKTRAFFYLMRFLQNHGWNEADAEYWREKEWVGRVRPWKD